MINTLLIPEIRDLLENEEYEILIDFCSSLESCTVAEFLGALSADELIKVLSILNPTLRSRISAHLDRMSGLTSLFPGEGGTLDKHTNVLMIPRVIE